MMLAFLFLFLGFGLVWHEGKELVAPAWMEGASIIAFALWLAQVVLLWQPNMVARP